MKQNIQRIYTPFTKDLCVATPWAYVNGKVSYLPLAAGTAAVELIEDVEKSKMGVVDANYSLVAGQKGHAEDGQIELTLLLPDEAEVPEKGVVKLGLGEMSMPIFPSGIEHVAGVTIGGTFGDSTLAIIAALAERGSFLKINGMHVDADDNKHFTSKMIERQFRHDGSGNGDRNHLYPKAQASDEQTTIRSLAGMDVFLDGFGYLEIPIYKGIEVNITLDTTYVK